MRRSRKSQFTFDGAAPRLLLAAADRRLRAVAVTQHLEPDELVDVTGRQ